MKNTLSIVYYNARRRLPKLDDIRAVSVAEHLTSFALWKHGCLTLYLIMKLYCLVINVSDVTGIVMVVVF